MVSVPIADPGNTDDLDTLASPETGLSPGVGIAEGGVRLTRLPLVAVFSQFPSCCLVTMQRVRVCTPKETAVIKNNMYLALTAIVGFSVTNAQATDIGPIVVTASRTTQTEDDALASVSVITRQDMERLQAHSLQDLLRGLPGLSLSNSGGAGKTTSLFMRGTESDHVLVLVDGIRLGSATLGTTSLQDLPIDQIERIEIVRGPRSSLYGSEAIGGVIQIFTRRGSDAPKRNFSLKLSSHATSGGTLGLSDGGERGWYSANLSYSDTDGVDACSNNPAAGCYNSDPDRDGYRNASGSLSAGYRFDNGLEMDLHALRANGHNEYDGSYANQSDTRQQVVGGSLHYAPSDSLQLRLTGGQSRDESDNFKDGVYFSTFNTRQENLSLQGDLDLGAEQQFTLGADYLKEQIESNYAYDSDTRDNLGAFAQYLWGFSAHKLQLSLRQDDNQAFGRHTTGGLAWGYALDTGLRLRASYATAFKAPTFNELYYPGYGNPNLQPEESASLEVGIEGKAGWGRWSLSAYRTRIDQLVGFDAYYSPVNIDRARINGLEATLDASIGLWQSSLDLTLLDPRNRSGGVNDGNLLPRRPRQSLRLDLDRTFGAYGIGLTLLAEGRRYDDLANRQEIGGYGSLDLRASYRINDAWRLQGRCENLFDKSYRTSAYYNQLGRSFYLTLSYQS